MWHQRFIFQISCKIKEEKDLSDPQHDSTIQPKTRGLLHMEREFIAHHIKDDSGLEHLIASMQPRNYSKDYPKHSVNVFRSTRCLQDSTTKSSGACQTQGSVTAHRRGIF